MLSAMFDENNFFELSLEERGVAFTLLACLHERKGQMVDLATAKLTEEQVSSLVEKGVFVRTLCLDSLCEMYRSPWLESYFKALQSSLSSLEGDYSGKASGLSYRASEAVSSVGYAELGRAFEGKLPTNRYQSQKEVYVVPRSVIAELSELCPLADPNEILTQLYRRVMHEPKYRHSARNYAAAILKYAQDITKDYSSVSLEEALNG